MKHLIFILMAMFWTALGFHLYLDGDQTGSRIYFVGAALLLAIVTAWVDLSEDQGE